MTDDDDANEIGWVKRESEVNTNKRLISAAHNMDENQCEMKAKINISNLQSCPSSVLDKL